MQEIMANPFYFWGAIMGLALGTAILLSSIFFMLALAFATVNKVRMKSYKRGVCEVLENTFHTNVKTNVAAAKVAKELLVYFDPGKAKLLVLPDEQ